MHEVVPSPPAAQPAPPADVPKQRLLPKLIPIDSPQYYVFLGAIAILVLGPLGGVTASYMNFSLGFFVGGQVLAGILGSTVTYFYGPEGKHGANYMQTMAASVASMAAMGVLIQAMIWLGLPAPASWKLILYFLCVGMFGVGVGMLYTPILVDKLKLTYPSGMAVASILRALTDVKLLKRSVTQLFTGIAIGFVFPFMQEKLPEWLGETAKGAGGIALLAGGVIAFFSTVGGWGLSTSTVGAGVIVSVRITGSAIVYACVWRLLQPWLIAQGWLGEHDPYRKFAFVFALGTIMGAAAVDISIILKQAVGKLRAAAAPEAAVPGEEWKQTDMRRLVMWLVFWGIALFMVAWKVMDVHPGWLVLAIGFAFIMMLVNGISLGITDQNPISSAFVVTVVVMAALGLMNPIAGLLSASIVFISCAVGGDMQQDRSTGSRLGTNRTKQFRYQVIGIFMGAVLTVYMAKIFMEAYPVLKIDTFSHPEAKVAQWQSAMTYKFVGALRGLTNPKGWMIPTMLVGFVFGLAVEIARKVIKGNAKYKDWSKKGGGRAFDVALDAAILPSPYASSFAGFVEFGTAFFFGIGGVAGSLWNEIAEWRAKSKGGDSSAEALPEDMSTTSLVGGGLIAGDAIAALVLGIAGLIASGAISKIFGG
ncbi:MAG: OPT/YSL family transporter [Myxococcaceae bacterium]